MNKNPLILLSLLVGSLAMTGCATQSNPIQVYAPNEQLDDVLLNYAEIKPVQTKCVQQQAKVCSVRSNSNSQTNETCETKPRALKSCQQKIQLEARPETKLVLNLNCHDSTKPVVDCYRFASELNALHLQYPNNKRIMMATALLEFELGNTANSQQLLDILLSKRGAYPQAAILRSRIAMEEGNLTLARSVVSKQLSLTPDNPYLYEMQASYYYVEGKYTEALQSIKIAERFMQPNWRTGYHRGIIYEAQEQWYKACKEYNQILQDDPDNRMVYAKILLLGDEKNCYVKSKPAPFNQF